VPNARVKTGWECEEGHQWEARYNDIQRGTGCPACVEMVQGARVSHIQRALWESLGGELNRAFKQYNIDVAMVRDGIRIAVEYDSWYWHAGREEHDARRDEEMAAAGWRILRVKSNAQLPAREQLDGAIARLLAGEEQVEIVLDDWGEGPTKFEVD
jgi:very-short-patch-repair endonuclease